MRFKYPSCFPPFLLGILTLLGGSPIFGQAVCTTRLAPDPNPLPLGLPSTARIIGAMTNTTQTTNPYLVLSAHRGYWRYFPENSYYAFRAAVALGTDAVELDVSETGDAVPVPVMMHDTDISRTTNYSGAQGDIHQVLAADFANYLLRDRHGCVSQFRTETFAQELNNFNTFNPVGGAGVILTASGTTVSGPVVIVDVKDRRTGTNSAGRPYLYQTLLDSIKAFKSVYPAGSALRGAVVFKVKIATMPQFAGGPAQFAADVASQTGDSYVPQMIYIKFSNDPLPGDLPADAGSVAAADPTFTAYMNDPHTLHIESNEKYLNDSMTPYRNYMSIAGRAIAGYSPENSFAEGEPVGGRCCTTENINYSQGTGANQSSPQPGCTTSTNGCLDLRGRWDFLDSTQMTVMTVERIDDALNYAKQLGRRTLP